MNDPIMRNHLFIGLGGQGGNTIAALRKVFASRDKDIAALRKADQDWDFLYIDSSRDVSNVRKTWTHFGEDLSLKPDSFLYLKDDGASISAGALAMRPDVAPWIGDTSILDGFLAGTQGIVGANQRRRLGRLLFAKNADRIRTACQQKITPMLAANHQCAIHIFASLAGGTGSGGLVDLITTLRNTYNNAAVDGGFPIFLYLYVTDEKFPDSQVGYFHENQAAVLRDLNALACARYHPHLVGTAIGGQRFQLEQSITQVILSSQLSSKSKRLSLEQQHQIVAEATFERIHACATGNLSTAQQKALTGEDAVGNFPGEPTKNPLRSFRFGSLGMRRWEVPIDEIKELLASDLTNTCLNHLLFQNWNDQTGPTNKLLAPEPPAYQTLISAFRGTIEKQKAETIHLEALMENLTSDVQRYHEGKRQERFSDCDLETYERGIRDRFEEHLSSENLGDGVDSVFRSLEDSRPGRVNAIEKEIHDTLRSFWRDPKQPLGLAYFHKALNDLQKQFTEAMEKPDTTLGDRQLIRDRMQLRTREWRKLTPLSRPLRQEALAAAQRDDTLSTLKQELRDRITHEDSKLLNEIIRLLGQLAIEYHRASKTLESMASNYHQRRDQLHQDLRALVHTDQRGNDSKIANRVELSLANLDAHLAAQRMERNSIQNLSSVLIDGPIQQEVGNNPISKIGQMSPAGVQQFEESAEPIFFGGVEQIHDDVEQITGNAVLTGSIMDILAKHHADDPSRFANDLKRFIDSSSSSLNLRTGTEIQPRAIRQDEGTPPMPKEALLISLPSKHAFSATLQQEIKPLLEAGSITLYSFCEHDDPTQIRMLTQTYWMAARFAQVVHSLDGMYEDSISKDRTADKRYFSNLDESGENGTRPPLLLPTDKQTRCSARAALWLAPDLDAPGTSERLIQEASDGVKLVENSDNGIKLLRIGDSLQGLRQSPDIITATLLTDAVTTAIDALDAEQLDAHRARVREADAELRSTKGVASPEYAEWTGDRDQILELLKR